MNGRGTRFRLSLSEAFRGELMRALLTTNTVCLLLLSLAAGLAVALTAPQSDSPASAPAAVAAPPAAKTAPSGTTADGDAAAKHAKRTACLKNAKTKKLLGAQKSAYIKDCIAAP
jgi:hypothetical protein